ncbi:MAG: hypothetical protein ABEJ86_05830 [Halococcoides sp.]
MTDDTNGSSIDGGQHKRVKSRTRRQFLKAGLATGAGAVALGSASLASGATKAKEICDGQTTYEEIHASNNVALIDNQWGDKNCPQCIWLNEDGSFGWDFQGQGGSINYPQLYTGTRPWGKNTNSPPFPTARRNIDQLVMEVDADINISGGEWNLAEEWWLLDGQPTPDSPNMKWEVMLVLKANPAHREAWSGNKPWETVGTDQFGNTIKFWANNNGGTNAPQIIYWVEGGMTQSKVDLTLIMDDMDQRFSPRNDLTFTGVELGTEYSGYASGSVTFNHFGLTVNGNSYSAGSGESITTTTTTTETPTDTPTDTETPTETTTDDPSRTEIRLEPAASSVTPGASTSVDIVLGQVPDGGLSGYELTLSIDNPNALTVANPTRGSPVSFPSAFSSVNSYTRSSDGSSIMVKASDGNDQISPWDTDVVLATVDLAAQDPGAATLSVSSIAELQTNTGVTIPADTPASSITVESGGPSWPHNPAPTDPNGDGLYEDLNGNGDIGFPDVNMLFQNSDTASVQNNAKFYDFESSGTINLQDVMALFQMV